MEIIAPVLSTIISYIFKEFMQQQIIYYKILDKLLMTKSISIFDKKMILTKENSLLLRDFLLQYILQIYTFDLLKFKY